MLRTARVQEDNSHDVEKLAAFVQPETTGNGQMQGTVTSVCSSEGMRSITRHNNTIDSQNCMTFFLTLGLYSLHFDFILHVQNLKKTFTLFFFFFVMPEPNTRKKQNCLG